MKEGIFFLAFIILINYAVVKSDNHYINEWATQIQGGKAVAEKIARDHGYTVLREIPPFADHYVLTHNDVPVRSKRSADHHTKRLTTDNRVTWAEQQVSRIRSKRSLLPRDAVERAYDSTTFDDPLWTQQWYIKEQSHGTPRKDLKVVPVWKGNFTGRGVVVTVLDDGLEYNHIDIKRNYDPKASYDLNDDDPDPSPRYDPTNENKHGTRCAGEIAMVADNGVCGVGVAFNAKIGGVRMLDGRVTDEVEGKAIAFNHRYVDIYSASWGPNDDGATLEGPGVLATKAFELGIKEGRNGKGNIYVWASGNGGRLGDNCDCDGYTGSIYTLSISSASQHQAKPWYGEMCASTMATTYSSGTFEDGRVASADLHGKCTVQHTGTSAAAPLAAGIIALLLEANPNLTWRDVQHLVAWTSDYWSLSRNGGWKRNGAGLYVNNAFGFGLLNAERLVNAADPQQWKTVHEKSICTITADSSSNLPQDLSSGQTLDILIKSSGCKGQSNEIKFLEHVEVKVTMSYSKRGVLGINLKSPTGPGTVLLSPRKLDRSSKGFHEWKFMSVHNWGESPEGDWKVTIQDKDGHGDRGFVRSIELILHGTKEMPDHVKRAGGTRDYGSEKQSTTTTQTKQTAHASSQSSSQKLTGPTRPSVRAWKSMLHLIANLKSK